MFSLVPHVIWGARSGSSAVRNIWRTAGLGRYATPSEEAWRFLSPWSGTLFAFGALPMLVTLSGAMLFGAPPWSPDPARIDVVWQVQATVLGLIVALTLFGLEVMTRTSLVVILETAVRPFVLALRAGLVVTAVVGIGFLLQPVLTDAGNRWAALASIGAIGTWFLLVAWGIALAFAAAIPRQQTAAITRRLRLAATVRAKGDVTDRYSERVLAAIATASGAEYALWIDPREGDTPGQFVRLDKDGVIADIHLGRLRAGLSDASSMGAVSTQVVIRLGTRLYKGHRLVRSDVEIPQATRSRLSSSVFIRPASSASDQSLELMLEELFRISLMGLRTGSVGIEGSLDGFEASLESYAEVWTAVEGSLADSPPSFEFGGLKSPVGEVTRHIGRLIESSPRAPSVDDVYLLSYFPLKIASRAIEWKAPAYFALLSLYPLMYRVAQTASGPAGIALKDRSSRHLLEALWLVIPGIQSREEPPVDAEVAARATEAVRANLLLLLENAIQIQDFATFSSVFRRWRSAERRY